MNNKFRILSISSLIFDLEAIKPLHVTGAHDSLIPGHARSRGRRDGSEVGGRRDDAWGMHSRCRLGCGSSPVASLAFLVLYRIATATTKAPAFHYNPPRLHQAGIRHLVDSRHPSTVDTKSTLGQSERASGVCRINDCRP